jgi:Arc/MetJ-type ribon-helix-helix transcriptional regulator
VSKVKTSIYLPSELHWKFKEEVVRRRFASDTAAMEAAIREWTEGDSTVGSVPEAASADRWHRMLAEIMVSGDTEAIRAVQQNLRVIFRAIAAASELHLERPSDASTGRDRRKERS